MTRGSKEQYELQEFFERTIKTLPIYINLNFARDTSGRAQFYESGELNALYHAFMAGYAHGKAIGREQTEIGRLSALTGWQPVETAPKDGAHILVMHAGYASAATVRWDEDHEFWRSATWGECYFGIFTHWMPIPKLLEE